MHIWSGDKQVSRRTKSPMLWKCPLQIFELYCPLGRALLLWGNEGELQIIIVVVCFGDRVSRRSLGWAQTDGNLPVSAF